MDSTIENQKINIFWHYQKCWPCIKKDCPGKAQSRTDQIWRKMKKAVIFLLGIIKIK